jgi:AAA family ATP:ADP antiporter
MNQSGPHASARDRLAALLGVAPHEARSVATGMLLFLSLFASYFMLRPVRETMGIAGGVDNLQWLFTGTFIATLAVLPAFGLLAARVQRRRILPWTYGFVALTLLAFALGLALRPDSIWLARAFYVWYSVINLLTISVAWSVLADLFAPRQAQRLFALMAAGASAGGLLGPLLGVLLVRPLGHAGLLGLSASLLCVAIGCGAMLQRWRDRQPLPDNDASARAQPLGGNPFAGLAQVARSPFLLGIAAFVLLLASATTFLYFEQARLVAIAFPDRIEQTRVFGLIDSLVQALAILAQVFITGRVAHRLGVGVLLAGVPLVVCAGFLWLAFAPVFAVLAVAMVVRRAGEYAFVRPGREMLYTLVPPAAKYKAKNFIDTVVYRGGDALSAWLRTGIDAIAQQPAAVALVGAALALVWAGNGAWLGRRHAHAAASSPA